MKFWGKSRQSETPESVAAAKRLSTISARGKVESANYRPSDAVVRQGLFGVSE